MDQFEGILKLVDMELEAINKNGKFRSREEIDSVYKLIDIAKDIECIHRWNDEDMYSDMQSYGDMRYSRDNESYARGRRNARRDDYGRYSRENYYNDGRSYNDRSYRGGNYSRDDGKEEYKEHLRSMMDDAPDEQTRQSIKRMLDNM